MKFLHILLLALALIFTGMLAAACESGETPVEPEIRELMVPPTSILRSDMGTQGELDAALALRSGIREKSGIEINLETDWVKRGEEIPAANAQILLGNTNRGGSAAELEALLGARPNSSRDWSIHEADGSIYIVGCSDAAIGEATAYFLEHYVNETGICMNVGERYEYKYPYPEISIGGETLFAYSLPEAENGTLRTIRSYVASRISDAIGWNIPAEGGKPITMKLDSSLARNSYTIKSGTNGVTVSGSSLDAIKSGTMVLVGKLLDGSSAAGLDEKGSITLHKPDTAEPKVSGSYTSIGDPVFLIDDGKNLQSGWDRRLASSQYQTEATWSASNHYKVYIDNTLAAEPVWMERPFQPQSEGILVLDTVFNMKTADGLTFGIFDTESGKYAMQLTGRDASLWANATEKTAVTLTPYLRAELNLDTQKYTLWFDGEQYGPYDFTNKVKQVDKLVFALDKDAKSSVTPNSVLLYTKMPVLDRFSVNTSGKAPVGYTVTGNAAMTGSGDVRLSGETSMTRPFTSFNGKAAFEVKFLAEQFAKDTSFAITSGGKDVLRVSLEGASIRQGDKLLRLYDSNFWYTLRIEPDTRTGKAEVKINGKSYGYFDFENKAANFDGLTIRTGEGDSVRVDEVWVFQIGDHEDYVPAPLSSGSDGYYVAAQVCSLWRSGYHWGWDCISPFPELRPVLGYYDEGLPEVADWEIKYMAEHGVDYQLYCWYSTQVDQPIKNPGMYQHLHDGYFHAKYSDQMKFAIMWENANASHPGSSENFRNVIVPYWVEYYLTDPRYMTIDNKPVITIFSLNQLFTDFGTAEAVKAELNYVREVCVGLGYDGAIIMVQSASTDKATMDKIKSIGADSTYAYNWGKSNTSEVYINNVTTQHKNMDNIATISVGFNNVAWKGTRSELITPEDYKVALEWVRDEFSKNYEEDSWRARSIILSTWNEYGEGTYIMPSGVHGFDYIDAVREVFAPDNKYENIVPTENQLERLSTLYVQDRTLLRADYRINTAKTDDYVIMHSWNFTAGMDGWSNFFGLTDCAVTDGVLKVTSDKNDFAIQSAPALGIDISKIKAIRVTMKSSVPVTSEMFFITEADTGWAQDRSASARTEKVGEFVELILLMDNHAAWKGKLSQLRFDPNSKPGTFEIKSIELLGEEEPERLIRGSQELIFSQFFPYADNGVIMVPFDPKQAMLTFLSCGWTWDETSKTLTVLHFDDTMTFTVGSDKSLVNGSEIKLSHKVDELDGLPVLPIQDLFKHLSISDVTVIAQ